MDELIIYLRLLHMNDAQMQKIFYDGGAERQANKSPVQMRRPNQRMTAVYPVGIISGDEDGVKATGEGLNKFVYGRFRLEWKTRTTEDSRDNLLVLKNLKERSWDLIQGKRPTPASMYTLPGMAAQTQAQSAEHLPGLLNVRVGANYQVVWVCQIAPTRETPTADSTIQSHLTTYEVTLSRYLI